jgi:hypothetical protein
MYKESIKPIHCSTSFLKWAIAARRADFSLGSIVEVI